MIIREIQKNEKEAWDAFVAGHPRGHLLQSYAWGEVKAGSGWLPIRLLVEDQGEIKAAVQILKKSIPLTGRCIFWAPRGPVVDHGDSRTLDFLIGEVRRMAQEQKAVFFMVDPAVSDEETVLKDYLTRQGFVFSDKYGIIGLTLPKRVFHLDLNLGEDELLAGLSSSHRRNIHRADNKGVTVERRSDEESLKIFYRLFQKASKRKNFYIRSFNYQKTLFKEFGRDGNFELFLAMCRGQVVAGRLILRYGNKAWDMYAASDDQVKSLYANHLLVWQVLREMKARGCALFDFRGADSKDPASPLYGVHVFKKGFGPRYVEYIGEYYLVFSRFYFDLFNSGRVLLKRLLKTYKGLRSFDVKKLFVHPVDEKSLRDTVLKKYEQQEELQAHTQNLELGLLAAEKRLVNRYFKPGDSVLNIGCGAGREALALAKMGFHVTGTDLNPKMVEVSIRNAQAQGVKGDFQVMDACEMSFGGDSFDQVVMVGSIITHIPKRINRIAALKEARRVLKKDGHIILSTPNRKSHMKYSVYFTVVNVWRMLRRKMNKEYPLEANDRFGKKVSKGNSKGRVYFHMYSLEEMSEDIRSAGFKIIECRSNKELTLNKDDPQNREKDYFLYFVARKEGPSL